MKRIAYLLMVVFAAIALAGCGVSNDKKVLAKVDGETMTVKDFNDTITMLPKQYQDLVKGQKKNYLNDLVLEKLLYKKALKSSIDKDRDTQQLIKEATRKIIIARLIEKEVEKKALISDGDVKKYYDEHSEEFMLPERWCASHILVDTQEAAEAIRQELAGGASFEQLAKEKSKDQTAKSGGDIGYFSKGQLVPEFEVECFKLKTGEVSGVVKTQFGYHIIKLTGKKSPEVQEFAAVKDLIKKELERDKKKEILDKMMTELKSDAKIVINEKLLDEEIKKDAKDAEAAKAQGAAPEKQK